MNANQAMGQAQSPEQQLVALEQQKVQLQQQKLQSDTAVHAAEMELKNKKLELEENEQIISMVKTGTSDDFKKEKSEADRESKKELKAMELLTKIGTEEQKIDSDSRKELARILKDLIKDEGKNQNSKEMVGLNTLAKLAMEQLKKGESQ